MPTLGFGGTRRRRVQFSSQASSLLHKQPPTPQDYELRMFTSGFTNTPITKFLLIYILVSAVLLSILDVKHLAGIHVSPHLWSYGQFWRCALWHLAGFANSTEALFAGILVYQVRVVERAWGGRKVVVCIPISYLYLPISTYYLHPHVSKG